MKPVGCCSGERIPPPASLVPLPFQGRLITASLQTPYEIKLPHLHKKILEYQHCKYRQGQQPALASPRRTARYERISPDDFDMAALENCCPRTSLRGDVGIAPYTFQEERANFAGRFRHGCTRKLLPSVKPAGRCCRFP